MSHLKGILFLIGALLGLNDHLFAQDLVNQDIAIFATAIAQNNVQLIDVRTGPEYAEGHLENARLIDWKNSNNFKKAVEKLDKDKPIYVYCRSGRRSIDAGNYLVNHGFKHVFNLEGGIQLWQAKGKKIIK